MSRVSDIIQNRELFWVGSTQTVAEAARRMADLHVGAILVLNGEKLEGVFSERDIMTRVVVPGKDPERTRVSEVMSTHLTTIEEKASLEEAMELMTACSCRHLPVMREGGLVGFLSMRDLMHLELARKTEEIHHMRAYINGNA
jgi:CBS domain-containing protein